jgi:hypothetical protein
MSVRFRIFYIIICFSLAPSRLRWFHKSTSTASNLYEILFSVTTLRNDVCLIHIFIQRNFLTPPNGKYAVIKIANTDGKVYKIRTGTCIFRKALKVR